MPENKWIHRQSWDKYVCPNCSFEFDSDGEQCPNCGCDMRKKIGMNDELLRERLTKNVDKNNKNSMFGVKAEIIDINASISGNDIMPFVRAINKLAMLEDMLENGEIIIGREK